MGEVRRLHIDFETRSAVDISSAGAFRYITDDSFSLLLTAYAFDEEAVQVVDHTKGEEWPQILGEALLDPAVVKVAYNANFERTAIQRVTGEYCPPEQWLDAMVLAASCGLPLSLGQCSAALCLPKDAAKDKAGRDLIRRFCVPKKDGSFNEPAADPERWAQFCEYNRQDVVAERTIFHMLEEWLPDDTEHRLWCLDARINERGVRVDRTLAAHASEMDERFKSELTEKALALTGLDNPGSVTQVKRWLREQEGLDVMSLNKKAVADVVAQLKTEEAKEFMAIRSMLAKTSASKYDAMLRCSTDDDPHVHGTMQFFGAHTGRWAGRLLQVQNLPQNHLPDLAEARELVRAGDYETLTCLYDNVPGVLSELIRTGIVPEPGCKLVVADFSAIEARVTAWLAGEEWRMEVFRNGGDIYCASASQMFHVPVVKHGENGDLRQKGKVAELACIAEGQPVLTKRGLVPIQKVRLDDLVWDGAEWVAHDGVVCRGEKEVIRYGDLTATPDHLVFIEGADQPVRFELAATSGARLLRGDDRRTAVWEDSDYLFGEAMVPGLESLLCSDEMHNLRAGELDQLQLSPTRKDAGVPELLAAEGNSALARPENHSAKAALHESEGSGVQELRSEGNNFRLPVCESRGALGDRESWSAGGTDGIGPNRERQGLRSGESPLGNALTEQPEHPTNGATIVEPGGMAIQRERCTEENETGLEPRADSRRRTLSCRAEEKELAGHQGVVRRTSRVYDIINCGPRHRFTVSGVLVHNCGYGGGIGALKAFGGDKPWRDSKGVEHPGMTEEEMGEIVGRWRESSPKIVALWKKLERAATLCASRHTAADTGVHGIRYEWERGIMWLRLPSGRRMAYFNAEYRDFPRRVGTGKCLTYMVLNQTTRKWERVETFAGRLVENAVQAIARDCLREAMLNLSDDGWDIRFTVHDEIVCSEPEHSGRGWERMAELMGKPIDWAPGLLLRADGYECEFYQKD